MTRPIAVVVGILLAAGAVRPSAQSDADVAKRLVGAWRLVSWEIQATDGATRKSPMSVGSLMYADSGRMCAVIMDPGRPTWQSRAPSDAEVKAAYNGLVSYCGAYEVNGRDGFVVHHVDLEKSPGSVGIHRKRWFRLEDGGNRLLLRVDPAENGAGTAESRLTWVRVTR